MANSVEIERNRRQTTPKIMLRNGPIQYDERGSYWYDNAQYRVRSKFFRANRVVNRGKKRDGKTRDERWRKKVRMAVSKGKHKQARTIDYVGMFNKEI